MRILLVEDSERLQRSLKAGLEDLQFCVDQARDGGMAMELLATGDYDVVVLDLMLPVLSGLQVLTWMRERGNRARVLILSAMDHTKDRVRGLDMGADDYLVKPFAFDELVSRIRSLGRRDEGVGRPVLVVEDLEIDTLGRRVRCRGQDVDLSPAQFALLLCLARHRGRTFSQEQLIARLCGGDADITTNAMEAHVSGLRKKLAAAGCAELLRTRRGFGYLIE